MEYCSIDFKNCFVQDDAIRELFNALKGLKSRLAMLKIDLTNSDMSKECLQKIVETIKTFVFLKELRLIAVSKKWMEREARRYILLNLI